MRLFLIILIALIILVVYTMIFSLCKIAKKSDEIIMKQLEDFEREGGSHDT